MRIACAQLNTVVGDIAGNGRLIRRALADAAEAHADLVLVPELAVTGYPPEDLLLRPAFLDAARAELHRIAEAVRHGVAIIGFPEWDGDAFNAAAVVHDGEVRAIYRKRFLPNYGVFDEARYFRAGDRAGLIRLGDVRVGLAVCEDVWYPSPVVSSLSAAHADVICCISASPYHRGKGDRREGMLATRADDASAALAFCNQVGGQDDLVFDGRSAVFDAMGEVVARAPQFDEHLLLVDIDMQVTARRRLRVPLGRSLPEAAPVEPLWDGPAPLSHAVESAARRAREDGPAAPCPALHGEPEVWAALVTGLRDYVDKIGFPGGIIGLSGGIDSALCAALAVEALGAGRVLGVAMPSVHSAQESLDGARALADALGIELLTIPIAGVVDGFEAALDDTLGPDAPGVTFENLQARARGTLLMALSNARGHLVLATGNKSEMSVGYSTLYGDMVGGFAPLRDLSKTWVYRLARWRNDSAGREVIPEATIDRPPTAELRPDQLDTDSLPPYATLDGVLEGYVEQGAEVAELVERGFPADVVGRVVRMVDGAEYKRRQGPVGIKITPRAFGRDRRMPITTRHA
ncbi:MAG: NAD+ synthase [Miltoncostaeaceae bacterium]